MDQERDPSSRIKVEHELRRDLERTRQSMSETVDEIRGEVSQALDWQTYLKRYPEVFLIGGGAVGFLIARAIKGSGRSRNKAPDRGGHRSTQFEDPTIRRVVDMTTSALLAQAVPIIASKLRDLLGQKSENYR
jgi:hypothetical protein